MQLYIICITLVVVIGNIDHHCQINFENLSLTFLSFTNFYGFLQIFTDFCDVYICIPMCSHNISFTSEQLYIVHFGFMVVQL